MMPDIEAILVSWLGGLHPGVTVTTRLPSAASPTPYDGSQAIIQINRIGGTIDNDLPFVVDNPSLDIRCYGPTQGDAHDLSAAVRAQILGLKYVSEALGAYGASVFDANEFVGPQFFEEPNYPPAGCYLIQVGLSLKTIQ